MIKHNEESLMALAKDMEYYAKDSYYREVHGKAYEALRLAIREVLAERDEARTQRLNTYRDLNAVGYKLREAEAECERLRKLLEEAYLECHEDTGLQARIELELLPFKEKP